MIRLGIIDDDGAYLDALVRFLTKRSNIAFVLKANSLGAFFEALTPESDIDVLLLDISLAENNSLDHLIKIKKLLPGSRILIMTGHQESAFLVQALQQGADSYYLKSSSPEQLVQSIESTYRGDSFLDPKAATGLVEMFRTPAKLKPASTGFPAELAQEHWNLNRRELEVAQGLFNELSYKEIADTRHISPDTVRYYVKTLYSKASVNTRAELIKKLRGLKG